MFPQSNDESDRTFSEHGPDFAEQELGDQQGDVIPNQGYQMTRMVGLGGSAGALNSLQEFFLSTLANTGMAFVVVLHLSESHESQLAAVLQRCTSMPVLQVQDTIKAEPDCVYLIPPGMLMTSFDGYLKLESLPTDRSKRMAVDFFFRTLAETHGPHAVAVVLSGADGDGAIGLKRIKERGGLTVAQDPTEATFGEMPRAAIATGMVDWVLKVTDMPARLVEYQLVESQIRVPREDSAEAESTATVPEIEDENALKEILRFLHTRTGHDIRYYKRSTVLRRVARRLQVNRITELSAYLDYLRTNPGECGALLHDLLISVTNFFRDSENFEALKEYLPSCFRGKGSNDTIRVWVPACATGEEAYSLAILLHEHAQTLDTPPTFQVFASDLNEDAIRTAREGYFPAAIAADVSEERLRRYFIKEQYGFRVRRELRESILFTNHNVLKDSPFSRLDLISCRNLFIYLTQSAQRQVLDIFHFALQTDGLLFLGASEVIEEENLKFAELDKKRRLYCTVQAPRSGLTLQAGPSTLTRKLQLQGDQREGKPNLGRKVHGPSAHGSLAAGSGALPNSSELHFRLLEHYAPPSLIVDQDYNVIHVSERAAYYLQVPSGEPTSSLLRSAKTQILMPLRVALQQATQTGKSVEVATDIEGAGDSGSVIIRVSPASNVAPGWMVVFFDERSVRRTQALSSQPIANETENYAGQLERELDATRAHLRDTIEQYEGSNEELRASNEELQAINEELRTASEELETSREELHSINEELTTVNQELRVKVDELADANSDLQNLMASTEIATIFLDREMRVMRFTPKQSRSSI